MKLYDCTLAPNPRRVRIFLAEKGIEIDKVEMNIVEGDNLTDEFLAINPRGLLPTLELDDGTCIDETVAICRYFEELQPSPSLMGDSPLSKAIIESRQRQVEIDGLFPLGDILRNSVPIFSTRGISGTTGVDAIPDLVPRGIASYQRFLGRLNALLADNEYIAGSQFSIADISGLVGIDFAKAAKLTIPEEHEHTLRWYKSVSSRDSAGA